MQAKRITKSNVGKFVNGLAKDYTVIGPARKQDQFVFTELDEDYPLALDYPRTMMPVKKYLYPANETIFTARKDNLEVRLPAVNYALIGLHICEINAIVRLDMVLHDDPYYAARRKNNLIVGVSCKPTKECFCQSMMANELPPGICDIFLKEDGDGYLALAGTEKGRKLMNSHLFAATDHKIMTVKVEYDDDKTVDVEKIWKNMVRNYGNALWDEMAKQCLGCANCTVVCPLCYCFDVSDTTEVKPDVVTRKRCYDSCTLLNFATVTGGHKFRKDLKSRFRNLYTHKFKSYIDEFNVPACVGCGRCTAFCPAQINMVNNLSKLEVE